MRLINNRILKNLGSLINSNLELQSGYKSAADMVNDKNLKEIFVIYIQKISEYIYELKKLEKDLAGSQKYSNNLLKIFSFPATNSDEISVLRRCEKLEEKSIKEYEIILNEEIPTSIKEIFIKQYYGLKDTGFHMKSLEDQY